MLYRIRSNTSDLFTRKIPDIEALHTWVRDVSNYYLKADKAITEVSLQFRPSYIKAWEEFVKQHIVRFENQH
jgi:hypothetical protein